MAAIDHLRIWDGDKLKRREEALLLERFLTSETEALKAMGRDQAFVLALDAQYGEGKSWFLTRLRDQLSVNHPVAFVDAWVDDANNEPLVSIMAALDDALQPFLTKKGVREKLGALTRAALPIIGKAALGAGGKFFGRYLGEQFGDDAAQAVAAAGKAKAKDGDGPIDAAIDKVVEGVGEVVDGAAKAMLKQYRARQASRAAFKQNLRALSASIEASDTDPRHSPIFVVVDELDRCRPTYAISVLEEIKHLFDVPGLVFVIALHGKQLEASIEAVYGSKFNANDYLRRFFTRHYELRRLSIRELVQGQFATWSAPSITFDRPQVWDKGRIIEMPADEMAGNLLNEWLATPREAIAVIDALRLFVNNWDHSNTPIELPLVLNLLLHLVRGEDITPNVSRAGRERLGLVVPPNTKQYSHEKPGRSESSEFMPGYILGMGTGLRQLVQNDYVGGVNGYIGHRTSKEFSIRFQNGARSDQPAPMSTWSEYVDRVKELGRFVPTLEGDVG